MQCAASALVAGQLGSARLPAARGRRCGQQRSRAARVVGRYAAGAGAAPPPPAQAAPLPPAEPQAPAQRPPLPARRRVGVNVAPVTPPAPAGSGALRQLTAAAGQMAGSVAGGGGAAPQEPFTTNVQRAAAYTTAAEVLLSRSQVVDKEVITRQAATAAAAAVCSAGRNGQACSGVRCGDGRPPAVCPCLPSHSPLAPLSLQDQREEAGLRDPDVCGPSQPGGGLPLPAPLRLIARRQEGRGCARGRAWSGGMQWMCGCHACGIAAVSTARAQGAAEALLLLPGQSRPTHPAAARSTLPGPPRRAAACAPTQSTSCGPACARSAT